MLTKLLLLAVCRGGAAFGQDYTLRYAVNKSGAAAVATIQQPASDARRFNFDHVTISLSAATKVTIERDCSTAATATLQELQPKNPRFVPAAAKARGYVDSNASGCTVVHGPIDIPASVPITIDLTGHFLSGNGATQNLTVRTESVTATGYIGIAGTEVRQ
jgi:hypothetical protein